MRWLLGRAYRFGRGEARLRPDRDSPRFLGAPRYLWKRLLRRWFRWATSFRKSSSARYRAGQRYQVVRGAIREHRIMHANTRLGTPHSAGLA